MKLMSSQSQTAHWAFLNKATAAAAANEMISSLSFPVFTIKTQLLLAQGDVSPAHGLELMSHICTKGHSTHPTLSEALAPLAMVLTSCWFLRRANGSDNLCDGQYL